MARSIMQEDTTVELHELTESGDAAATIAVARDAARPTLIDVQNNESARIRTLVVGPSGDGLGVIESINIEELDPSPSEKAGQLQVHTADALVAYANRHVDLRASTLWGDIDHGRIVVVLNDHDRSTRHDPAGEGEDIPDGSEGAAGWADHQVSLQMTPSPEWTAWRKIDGQPLSQVELAEFLEERYLDVVQPDGSTLLTMVQTFEGTRNVHWKSAQRLESGEQQLVYQEEAEARAGSSQATVPSDLTLALRPWLGTDPVEVAAKFRYRIGPGGQLTVGVKLLNLEDIARQAVSDALDLTAERLGLTPIEGIAPSPRRNR